jgi:hypothetical protein
MEASLIKRPTIYPSHINDGLSLDLIKNYLVVLKVETNSLVPFIKTHQKLGPCWGIHDLKPLQGYVGSLN